MRPPMECKECGDEVEELHAVKKGRRTLRLCEDCADRIREEEEILADAESAIGDMMEYGGR